MERGKRIPLHNHDGPHSGGLIAAGTIVTLVGDGGGGSGSSASTAAADVTVEDAAGLFDGTNVEAVLAELAREAMDTTLSTVASSGSTETLDVSVARTHDVTLTADCTFTFSGAVTAQAWYFTLVLRQDGTGGWTTTWPGSVAWPGGVAPTLDETASTTEVLTFFTLDGGTTWYGFHAGGGGSSVGALDDLSDVTITTPAAGDRLRYSGSAWVNSDLIWRPVMTYDGTNWLVSVDGSGNAILTEA